MRFLGMQSAEKLNDWLLLWLKLAFTCISALSRDLKRPQIRLIELCHLDANSFVTVFK